MKIYKDLTLDTFQRDALQAIRGGSSVIVAAPTGCGKTLVAEYAIERALDAGRRIIYTAPIKALSNQKFRDFGREHGNRIGLMTGDVTINPGADALIMTTEIFRNTIFDEPERLAGVDYVIFDEVHYLDDPERGTVWEESIIFAPPEIHFVCLSATIANLDQLAGWMRSVRPDRLKVVVERQRPVPLSMAVYNGAEVIDPKKVRGRGFPSPPERKQRGRRRRMNMGELNRRLLEEIVRQDHIPCIFFVFSRAFVERLADAAMELRGVVSSDTRRWLKEHWEEVCADLGVDPQDPGLGRLKRLLGRGIAFHHAGMMPTHKELVERMFTSGHVKLLFATETFALGVNMPARAVAFETLKKFDGVKRDYMATRSFLQMAGRAGRRGIDDHGYVYANVMPREDDPAGVRGVMYGEVEEIQSQFKLSYSTILTLYSRLGDEIYEACKKSFAYFRHKKRKGEYYEEMVSLIRRRIQLLQERGYLIGRELTPKGRFASHIYGFEMELGELFAGGMVDELDPPALAVLLTSVIYESRREAWVDGLANKVVRPLAQRADALLGPLREAELELRLPPTKPLDWGLSRLAWEWALGADFYRVAGMTDLDPGDIVRTFRMVLQLLRQVDRPIGYLERPAADLERLRELFFQTRVCLKRGEVDAESQLRRAAHLDEPAPPEHAPTHAGGGRAAEQAE